MKQRPSHDTANIVGSALALVFIATLLGGSLFAREAGQNQERGASTQAGLFADDALLPGGEKLSVGEAEKQFLVPVYRPASDLASDSGISSLWMRSVDAPEVYITYDSGIIVIVRPASSGQPTKEYAAAQSADGVPGQLATVNGIEAYAVPVTKNGSGSIRFVFGGVLLTVVGDERFSSDDLETVASSIVESASTVYVAPK